MEQRVVTARVVGVPEPGVAVWVATDDPDCAGDLPDPPAGTAADDLVVLRVERDRFRWLVTELVERIPADGPSRRAEPAPRPPKPHAHPARPPGAVLVAWLPFTSEHDGPGKHRPCVVVHSPDPTTIRARPLYDADSAHVRRNGGVPIAGWRTAGLDKASVAVGPVAIPVARCEQTLGHVDPHDRARLGIDDS
jgi:hypothetical protein